DTEFSKITESCCVLNKLGNLIGGSLEGVKDGMVSSRGRGG
ncbi:hypothetical protein Tco_0549730, partial [Tanacetum coccineum]